MKTQLPNSKYFIGKPLPFRNHYIVEEQKGEGCNARVFRAHSEELNYDIACKIITRTKIETFKDPNAWFEEPKKANMLRHPAVVRCDDHFDWVDPDNNINCVVLVYQFVDGKNLEEYIKANKGNISINFVLGFLRTMFELLHEMKKKNIKHGDLHTGNIMVEAGGEHQINPHASFRVTDFAAWMTTDKQEAKDDYEGLGKILHELLANVNYQDASAHDRYTYDVLYNEFVNRHLFEKDITRDPLAKDPEKLFLKLKKIDEDFSSLEKNSLTVKLTTPFDYLNCEQIGEAHSILKALYSDKFLGLETIESRNNLILTGPRGCGKSTVFKSLSLRHRIQVDEDLPEDINYIGIYYSCNSDLYFTFPRYKLPSIEAAYDLPIIFLTASLLSDVLRTLQEWGKRHFPNEFSAAELDTSKALWEILGLQRPEQPGADSFLAIVHELGKIRKWAVGKQRAVYDAGQNFDKCFSASVLIKCCDTLKERFHFLERLPFFFFIDDYSSPKITKDLQSNLNRLLMLRSSSCFFKLSTESPVSFIRRDIDGKDYVESREFSLVNLGDIYLQDENDERKLAFIEDVFVRRFKAIDKYPVADLNVLIGSAKINNNEMARDLRDGTPPTFWGKESLSDLCSGDIHYVITLVGDMVVSVGGQEGLSKILDSPKISEEVQNASIRRAAGSFMQNLRGVPNGDKLVKIVTAFGKIANAYLINKNSKNVNNSPPFQTSRIEPLDDLKLSESAEELYTELLRFSVFLVDYRGKSRRGKLVPRLYLRRSLIPHFKLTFSNRDSLELENSKIEELLMSPEEFEKSMMAILKKNEKQMEITFSE